MRVITNKISQQIVKKIWSLKGKMLYEEWCFEYNDRHFWCSCYTISLCWNRIWEIWLELYFFQPIISRFERVFCSLVGWSRLCLSSAPSVKLDQSHITCTHTALSCTHRHERCICKHSKTHREEADQTWHFQWSNAKTPHPPACQKRLLTAKLQLDKKSRR